VADLIERDFQISYHPGHVWRILGQLNWNVQQPVGRALERNEAAIGEWKRKRWPEIKKKLKTIRSEQVIEFLQHLLRYIKGNILVIWDRLPAQKCRHAAIHSLPKRPFINGVSAALRTGIESGGVHLGTLQAPRVAQRLRQKPLGP
jgi:hypothetical protein